MHKCLSCETRNLKSILDLGKIPISNNFVSKKKLKKVKSFKLGLAFCMKCYLVQNLKIINNKEIFNNEYLYHSSYSNTWLKHSEKLFKKCIKKFKLNTNSTVLEIASNDGYLLNFFKKKKINCYGVEPSKSVSKVAKKRGIKVFNDFFSKKFVYQNKNIIKPDLILGLNVLAHTPHLNDFVAALKLIMKPDTICIFEIPYVKNLVKKMQIDTIYHEHYSYFSLISFNNLINKYSLSICDLEFIKTHGGSLRIYIKKGLDNKKKLHKKISLELKLEKENKLDNFNYYKKLQKTLKKLLKNNIKKIKEISEKNVVVGYGAAAKSTIMCNLLKLNSKSIKFVYEKNIFKQNKYIPAANIKIINNNLFKKNIADYMVIFPWNLKVEIINQIKKIDKKIKFITFEPEMRIFK